MIVGIIINVLNYSTDQWNYILAINNIKQSILLNKANNVKFSHYLLNKERFGKFI